ncbi:HPr kinase/phosphatase C-terminal domain-containing protein [Pseudorhodobacter sp.]|uniref:HPr kinase/phosphorylase n=1 Tax=Pseudorhodobacter sp. TaxID=1934400 RepID=UPI002AFDDA7F|nr:HPr kinase/phosphatase C-terminal domain-containing protein [Pseudorhodobacter sp.]
MPPPQEFQRPKVAAQTETLHATCVAVDGKGVLVLGASGAGKSALALNLLAHGAQLVADDRTILTRIQGQVMASCPPQILGLIEARGLGLLHADPILQAPICLIVDLDNVETERLPPKRRRDLLGVPIDLVFASTSRHFPVGLLQLLRSGRVD